MNITGGFISADLWSWGLNLLLGLWWAGHEGEGWGGGGGEGGKGGINSYIQLVYRPQATRMLSFILCQ